MFVLHFHNLQSRQSHSAVVKTKYISMEQNYGQMPLGEMRVFYFVLYLMYIYQFSLFNIVY